MSGSETGVNVMTSREPFSVVGVQQKSPGQSQPVIQNMRLAFSADGTAVYKPVTVAAAATTTTTNPTSPNYQPSPVSAVGGDGSVAVSPHGINVNMGSGSEAMKRKRGRPRKYGPDGTMALALVPATQSVTVTQSSGAGGFSSPTTAGATLCPGAGSGSGSGSGVAPPLSFPSGGLVSPTSTKKARGRPPGSSKKQQLDALGSAGFGFTPHVITVKAGEDVSSKIMSFAQHGPRAVCILSANGAISNVTLRQPATSGGTVTYEGRFEILSLSGSFMLSDDGGQRSRSGGLSVSLSGPDGRVLGGGVAGLLTAATPVQVVVGSFIADGRKESKSANQVEPLSATTRPAPTGGSTGASSPPSRGTLSESSGGQGSPLNQSSGACNNSNPQGMSGMPWK